MELRNIHFQPAASDPVAPAAPAPAAHTTPAAPEDTRLRARNVAVSPAEEYALRDGEVQPIADSLAALILSCNGRCEVSLKGVKIDRDEIGGVRHYHHADSIVCNDLSLRERKMFYCLNRLDPSIVHILDETGRYIETLPERGTPGVLDNAAQAKEYALNQTIKKRAARHLQQIHGKDTADLLQRARENAAEMTRVVQILPGEAPAPTVEPAPSAVGDRVQQGAAKINNFRKSEKAAIELGRAISASRGSRWDDESTSRTTPPQPKKKTQTW